jgi:Galactosyltransferase
MRILIAISTCELFESNGSNTACRETWINEYKRQAIPFVDYKFFVGTPLLEHTQPESHAKVDICGNHCTDYLRAAEDVVVLRCEDQYGALTYKTQESLQWAAARDYDFVFRCFPDTYVQVKRLLETKFYNYDYYGDFRGETTGWQNYASGGAGYFLSRRAYSYLLDQPILGTWRDDITPYAEDLWVGNRLGCDYPAKGIKYWDDNRFINKGQSYWPDFSNTVITSHLSAGSPGGRYAKELMYSCHEHWKKGQR